MKLIASLVATTAITGAVWGFVMLQPVMADSKLDNPVKTETAVRKDKPKDSLHEIYSLSHVQGITKTLPLDSISDFWQEFEQQFIDTNKLPQNLDRLVVLYQEINSDYTQAKVTIGYITETGDLTKKRAGKDNIVTIPSIEKAQLLLEKGDYSKIELSDAWQQINYKRSVDVLIETHYLTPQGLPKSSQLSIYYK